MVGEHTSIAIILSTLLTVDGTLAALGYALGRLRRERDERAEYIRQLQEHERRIRANTALIGAIADGLERPLPRSPRRHYTLPDGWGVYPGGAATRRPGKNLACGGDR